MLPGDLAFVFADLETMGQLSTVEITREGARLRNARGVGLGARTPVDGQDELQCWFTNATDQLLAAGYGVSEKNEMLAVFPPETDVQSRDELTVVSGFGDGQVYRVIDTHGLPRPGEMVSALVERKKA